MVNNRRLFYTHRVYIVTGRDNSKLNTISYVQAIVDARNAKVIALYSIDYPYQNMFSGYGVGEAEQVAENFSQPQNGDYIYCKVGRTWTSDFINIQGRFATVAALLGSYPQFRAQLSQARSR